MESLMEKTVEVTILRHEFNGKTIDSIYRGLVTCVEGPVFGIENVVDLTHHGHRGRGKMWFSTTSSSFVSVEIDAN